MTFEEYFQNLGVKASEYKPDLPGADESAIKNYLVLPFIRGLGYDPDTFEVRPEYFSNQVPDYKGEKVDYAIFVENKAEIFIECKRYKKGESITKGDHVNQLSNYYNREPSVKVGVLTNGVLYAIYTDKAHSDIMDTSPVFTFDLSKITPDEINKLQSLSKSTYNLQGILESAEKSKYIGKIKFALTHPDNQINKTSLSQLLASEMWEGSKANKAVRNKFRSYIIEAVNIIAQEKFEKKFLKRNIDDDLDDLVEKAVSRIQKQGDGIVTTEDEKDGFKIVLSILRDHCSDLNRIRWRDHKGNFSIILDDSTQKPICRFYFFDEKQKKHIGVIKDNGTEEKIQIDGLDDIRRYSRDITARLWNLLDETD
jgi:predicted type IV restriction endonuclease